METRFTSSLTDEEIHEIEEFYKSLKICTIEQHPLWNRLFRNKNQITYFLAYRDQKIIAFAVIEEHSFSGILSMARIEFGPLFRDIADAGTLVPVITDHYKKKKGFVYLTIQLAHPSGVETEQAEAEINQQAKIRYRLNNSNWSSVVVDLEQSEDEIFGKFHRGRKRAIKKSIDEGITVSLENTPGDIREFAVLFNRMNRKRKLGRDETKTQEEFSAINGFLQMRNTGYTLLVRNNNREVIGGLFLISQGETMRAYRGCDYLHFSLWEGMKLAKREGFRYFDLWGYNHYAKENDQHYKINQFKSLFGGDFLYYPKRMHIGLMPLGIELHSFMLCLKKVYHIIDGNLRVQ